MPSLHIEATLTEILDEHGFGDAAEAEYQAGRQAGCVAVYQAPFALGSRVLKPFNDLSGRGLLWAIAPSDK
jgi:hypothetical protein